MSERTEGSESFVQLVSAFVEQREQLKFFCTTGQCFCRTEVREMAFVTGQCFCSRADGSDWSFSDWIWGVKKILLDWTEGSRCACVT